MRAARELVPRGTLAVLLLAVALLATALLAWQAYSSTASHHAATVAVLHDYAGLAAAELVRRTANDVGYQGHYLLAQALAEPGAELAAHRDPRTRRAAALVRRAFSLETEIGRASCRGRGNMCEGAVAHA